MTKLTLLCNRLVHELWWFRAQSWAYPASMHWQCNPNMMEQEVWCNLCSFQHNYWDCCRATAREGRLVQRSSLSPKRASNQRLLHTAQQRLASSITTCPIPASCSPSCLPNFLPSVHPPLPWNALFPRPPTFSRPCGGLEGPEELTFCAIPRDSWSSIERQADIHVPA